MRVAVIVMFMRNLFAASSLLLVASCVSAPEAPPPPPTRYVPPPAIPAPTPVAAGSDWRDWTYSPGDWTYSADGSGSTARFGRAGVPADLLLRCDRARRQVTLARRAGSGARPELTVRTSSTVRALTTQRTADDQVAVVLEATDSILDAMGFSRGRFVVQQAGAPTLVVPTWAEILRVTEDCRG